MTLLSYRERKLKTFLPVVQAIAGLSKDPSTKVGALALGEDWEPLGWGYNGMPRGLADFHPERLQKPEKYNWFAHAEENLVAQAARAGISLKGATVLVWPLTPCTNPCARVLIQAGVKRVCYWHDPSHTSEKWRAEADRATQMFKEAGVLIIDMTHL